MKLFDKYKLPIWNYYQAVEKNDYRYCIILEDYGTLPDVTPENISDCKKVLEDARALFPKYSFNLKLIEKRIRAWDDFYFYLKNKSENAYNRSFAEYKMLLNIEMGSVVIDKHQFITSIAEVNYFNDIDLVAKIFPVVNVVFKSINELYDKLRTLLDYNELLKVRMFIIESLLYESEIENHDIMNEVTTVEMGLSKFNIQISIDIFTTSIVKYMLYRSQLYELVKKQKK